MQLCRIYNDRGEDFRGDPDDANKNAAAADKRLELLMYKTVLT